MIITPDDMQRELDRLLCRMRAIHPPPPPTPCVPHEPHPLKESEAASVNGQQAISLDRLEQLLAHAKQKGR